MTVVFLIVVVFVVVVVPEPQVTSLVLSPASVSSVLVGPGVLVFSGLQAADVSLFHCCVCVVIHLSILFK